VVERAGSHKEIQPPIYWDDTWDTKDADVPDVPSVIYGHWGHRRPRRPRCLLYPCLRLGRVPLVTTGVATHGRNRWMVEEGFGRFYMSFLRMFENRCLLMLGDSLVMKSQKKPKND